MPHEHGFKPTDLNVPTNAINMALISESPGSDDKQGYLTEVSAVVGLPNLGKCFIWVVGRIRERFHSKTG